MGRGCCGVVVLENEQELGEFDEQGSVVRGPTLRPSGRRRDGSRDWVKQHHVEETALLALFLFALSFYKDYAPRSAQAYSRTMDEQIEPGYHTNIEKTPDYSTRVGRSWTTTKTTNGKRSKTIETEICSCIQSG